MYVAGWRLVVFIELEIAGRRTYQGRMYQSVGDSEFLLDILSVPCLFNIQLDMSNRRCIYMSVACGTELL